jgi:hypothetical protein
LQVVFHAVMYLSNSGILGDNFAFLPTKIGGVAAEHKGADSPSIASQWNGANTQNRG